MSLFIFVDILKEHAIQMSQTFYVTVHILHYSSIKYSENLNLHTNLSSYIYSMYI